MRLIDGLALTGLGATVYASLVPSGPFDCASLPASLLREGLGRSLQLADVTGNVLAYMLLSACLMASANVRGRAQTWSGAVLVLCSLLSLIVEIMQACLPARISSGWDWGLNSLGAGCGVLLMRVLLDSRIATRFAASRDADDAPPWRLALAACLAWAVFATAPWQVSDPSLVLSKWRGIISTWEVTGVNAARLLGSVLQATAVGMLIGQTRVKPQIRLLAGMLLAVLVPAAALFVMRPYPILELWIGVPAGLCAGLLLSAALGSRGLHRLAAALMLMFALAALAEWALRAAPGRLVPFRVGLRGLEGDALEGIRLLGLSAWIAMSTAAAGWVLGIPGRIWAGTVVAVLLLAEVLQAFTPGHVADLTGPVFGLAGVLVGALLLPAASPRLQSRPSVSSSNPLF